jgi:hypothetical protein
VYVVPDCVFIVNAFLSERSYTDFKAFAVGAKTVDVLA